MTQVPFGYEEVDERDKARQVRFLLSRGYSMSVALKVIKSLLAQLQSAASSPGDVYVSIIPFSKDVNVGSGYYDQTWIDWTSWNAANQNCTWNWNGSNWTSTCTTKSHTVWNGCVTDRSKNLVPSTTYGYDQSAENPDPAKPDSLFPAERWCQARAVASRLK